METPTHSVTSSSGAPTGSSTTAAPLISLLTVTLKPLTTTFTPPASCGEMRFSQLSSPGYQIWLNEPQPVPGQKFGDCYPSDLMAGYSSVRDTATPDPSSAQEPLFVYNSSSSIAPLFSPLVCPEGWNAVETWASNYIACCASGFQFAPPSTTIDENRPAYGGTCYTGFTVDQVITVTAFNSASATATVEWRASATNDQAYAHPIDGFQQAPADTMSSTLSGSKIVGIVLGSTAALVAILVAILFMFQRYRQRKNSKAPFDGSSQLNFHHHQQQQQQYHAHHMHHQQWNKEQLISPSVSHLQSPYYSTIGNVQRYELGTVEPKELDAGWAGQELDSPRDTKRDLR
ncbi:hypothetical protein GGR54DRAFT_642540 [Hypoxylon sp. NC1633]|nr:hypothetical protein GGR54DRAFT_642540 [Hypoxylon sp. NC1633]